MESNELSKTCLFMEFIVTMGSGKGRIKLIKFHVFVILVTDY